MTTATRLTHGQVFSIAWPIILANASVPLLGIVDTAVIGNQGSAAGIGAIAIGALIFNFIYWAFGFLRMGTTGITAQALGARNDEELIATLGRAVILAAVIGVVIVAVQALIRLGVFAAFQGTEAVESAAQTYFTIRIWGAPAALFGFACLGWFIGLKHSGYVLALQLLLNGINITLDVWFVMGLDLGVRGVALGTVIAEWTMAVAAAFLLLREIRKRGVHLDLAKLRLPAPMLRMVTVNRDIFIRTLALLGGFVLFNWESTRMGELPLAANHILLQFISFGAFFLDGFAFAVEALVGEAIGAKNVDRLKQAVRKSTEWALGTAFLLAIGTWVTGDYFISLLTNVPEVRAMASTFLPFAILYMFLGVWPFQLDGIFIGATRTPQMRNAMVISFAAFVVGWLILTPLYGNAGLWAAFVLFLTMRAVTLGLMYPALVRAAEH